MNGVAGRDGVAHAPLSEADVLRLVDVKARWRYRLARVIATLLLHLVFRIEVMGAGRIPRSGPYVVAANHANWLDAPLIAIVFPANPRINFVADGSFVTESRAAWLFVRQIGGVLPVVLHGHGTGSLRRAVDACLDGRASVAFFPEGAYGEREEVLEPFHHGFAAAAIAAGAPVVPVFVSGTSELWLRKHVVVNIGEPVESSGQTASSLMAVTREQIEALRPAPTSQPGPRLFSPLLSRIFHGRVLPRATSRTGRAHGHP